MSRRYDFPDLVIFAWCVVFSIGLLAILAFIAEWLFPDTEKQNHADAIQCRTFTIDRVNGCDASSCDVTTFAGLPARVTGPTRVGDTRTLCTYPSASR